jgi:hypothetical protein
VLAGRLRIDPVETTLYSRLHVSGLQVGDDSVDFTVDQRRGGVRVVVDRCPPNITAEHPS